jgi:hypothetical protein
MRDLLHRLLAEGVRGLTVNGHPDQCLPNTLNVSFPGVSGRALLHAVESVLREAIDHVLDLDAYRILILSTHPEYWTVKMYAQLQNYLNAGGSLLYLGGNGIYEEGEYTDDQTGMIFLAGVEGGDRSVAYFRNLNPPKPEFA